MQQRCMHGGGGPAASEECSRGACMVGGSCWKWALLSLLRARAAEVHRRSGLTSGAARPPAGSSAAAALHSLLSVPVGVWCAEQEL